jgi:dipeptidyl aminopeptidase/acylaminoacyl peptidase
LKGRDLAILAAVILLGGFALADSLRSRGDARETTTTETTRADRNGAGRQPDAPEEWPLGRLSGTLVFTDADDCRVRVVGLGGGRERPTSEFNGTCNLWPAPVGQRIAYGIAGGTSEESLRWFSIVDLAHANRELGTFKNLVGDVLWSPDAQRVAWCEFETGAGLELEIGNERPRRLASCPIAYDPEGRLVFARGKRLLSGGRVVLVENEPITQVHWGDDESLLVRLAGGIVRRYGPNGPLDAVGLSTDRTLVPSPDNCAVLFEELGEIHLVDLGCAGIQERIFFGRDAAWSPDGRWVAVADPDQIEFHDILAGDEVLVWPAHAAEIFWRGEN